MEQLQEFSVTSHQVAIHSFLPLLGYQKVTRKIDFSVFPPIAKNKERDIRYASHTDSAIYSIYARDLSIKYELCLKRLSLSDTVLAYRGGIGYNVPFAKSLIEEIRKRKDCLVICLDISGFFDNIPHDLVRKTLCEVLAVKRLPDDWFNIFNRVTKFEFVLREAIEAKIGKITGGRICTIDTFRRAIRPLVNINTNSFGIPQGTPLSGLLANVAMKEFDCGMREKVVSHGGSYRRYSDDIAIVLPGIDSEVDVIAFAHDLLSQHGLSFNDKKTCRTTFHASASGQACSGDMLQYLGFIYDGSKILIRPESMKNFYARMKGNIGHYIRAATRDKIPLAELRKRVLIGRFTHWGDSRNFVQYAYRAAREMNSPEIKRQLRNHVAIFDRHWAKMVMKYGP